MSATQAKVFTAAKTTVLLLLGGTLLTSLFAIWLFTTLAVFYICGIKGAQSRYI